MSISLKLKNICGIKEANLDDISGLSVIAGENDSGKSTIGKVIMALIKAHNKSKMHSGLCKDKLDKEIEMLFDGDISSDGSIELNVENMQYLIDIKNNECTKFDYIQNNPYIDCTFIQTSMIWELVSTINSILRFKEKKRQEFDDIDDIDDIRIPYIVYDLYYKICETRRNSDSINIEKDISKIINGSFVLEGTANEFVFMRPSEESIIKEIKIPNTATGIRQFGILQMLSKNKYITPNRFFIFDEPENHLHPQWQVRFAEILVRLVKNGISVMVNTHSPYMIEALQKFSDKYRTNTHFYFANDGVIRKESNSNNATLEKIFNRLNQPFIEFDELECELEGRQNG